VDRGVAVPGGGHLAVGHQPVTVEDPDGGRGHVLARALPVADDVCLLDDDLTHVVELLRCHHLVDGACVGKLERSPGESVGEIHGRQ
jgi:hypothetical protein